MVGLAHALAGAMAGAGKGIAQVGLEELELRRLTTLENLRSRNNRAEQNQKYDLADRNDARQTERSTNADITKAGVEEGITARSDARRHGYAKELKQIDFNNDVELRRVASQLNISEDEVKRKRDAREINRIEEDGDGKFTIFYNNGTAKRTDVPAQQRTTSGNGGSALANLRNTQPSGGLAQGGSTPPAPAAKPAAAPAKPKAAQAGKTYTQADAAATAKQYGISINHVHQKMRELGYKLTD